MKGVSSLRAGLMRSPSRAQAALQSAVFSAARETADAARARAPVRTGRLRASIDASAQGPSSAVSARVNYAVFVERRRPFLLPSVQESRLAEDAKKKLREVF